MATDSEDTALAEYRNRINAQVTALRVAVLALIHLHPERQAVAARMTELGEHLTAGWLNSQLPDVFLTEFQKQMEDLQKQSR
jgi:gluconate kinase